MSKETLSLEETFIAALHAVGTAGTVAAAGMYLHRRGMVSTESKTVMARFVQQIGLPALFFSNFVRCPENDEDSDITCPNLLQRGNLSSSWILLLLLWPVFVASCGFLVGHLLSRLFVRSANDQVYRGIMVATAFSNSTVLPITLFGVIMEAPAAASLFPMEPNLFLSIYLMFYPILQWGLGGWLLADTASDELDKQSYRRIVQVEDIGSETTGYEEDDERYATINFQCAATQHSIRLKKSWRKDPAATAVAVAAAIDDADASSAAADAAEAATDYISDSCSLDSDEERHGEQQPCLVAGEDSGNKTYSSVGTHKSPHSVVNFPQHRTHHERSHRHASRTSFEQMRNLLSKSLQPPVLGAMFGLIVSCVRPVRGVFVDMQEGQVPYLNWFFDGVATLGKVAVPLGMTLLGVNLSMSVTPSNDSEGQKPTSAVGFDAIGVAVIGKMVIMPIIGIVSTLFLKIIVLDSMMDPSIRPAFCLVMMIVFITPSAINVMIMVDLFAGTEMKNGMAKIIGAQYLSSVVLLPLSLMSVFLVATS